MPILLWAALIGFSGKRINNIKKEKIPDDMSLEGKHIWEGPRGTVGSKELYKGYAVLYLSVTFLRKEGYLKVHIQVLGPLICFKKFVGVLLNYKSF